MRFSPGPQPMPAVRTASPQGRGRVLISGQRGVSFRTRFGFRPFRHRFHHRFFFNDFSCFNGFNNFNCANPFLFNGFGFGFPFVGPGFDPFFFSSDWQQPAPQQPVVMEQDNGANRELALEVQELSDEIQSMRDEERARENRSANAKPTAQDDGPNTTLVFRDGLQLSVRNYAVAGDTIWVLDQRNARKIPLSKIDLAATQQVNEKNGVEFHLR